MKLLGLLLLVLVSATTSTSPSNSTIQAFFNGYQVHRITPHTEQQLNAVKELEESCKGYDFWTSPSGIGRTIHIMVPPNLKEPFRWFLKEHSLEDNIWIENVQKLVDTERPRRGMQPRAPEDFGWEDYHTLEEIYEWLDWLVVQNPEILTTIIGGLTYEGRQIRGVKLSYGPDRKGVFIESGIHAREWIAPATVTYILNELITSTDEDVRALAEKYDWYFFPSVNPDGYAYTHASTLNRMWRKTRKPYGNFFGADPNRNWDYFWMDGGASSFPGSDSFAGGEPFSEIETKSLAEYISTIGDTLEAYLAFHSFSQLMLIPFGHSGNEVPENQAEMLRVGNAAAKALYNVYGTRYIVGNIPNTIYVASGGSIDWVLGYHRNIRLVYAYELRDTGEYGFILPANQIIPTAEETLVSLVAMFQQASDPPAEETTTPEIETGPTGPNSNQTTRDPGATTPGDQTTTPDGSATISLNIGLLVANGLYLIMKF